MALPRADADQLARQGLDALRNRDGARARAIFDRLAVEAPADVPRPWLPLAQACRLIGDAPAETEALQALLLSLIHI